MNGMFFARGSTYVCRKARRHAGFSGPGGTYPNPRPTRD
ncbi:MAG: hypothetical protein AVDCRST_MAG89-3309 [uncultured Gemmatimonadetes bacterium]|uniref:Uncharacterized protein n=1 Tax=uncultured Gemmatimonadota bacterium TaxID=203437 RepID=A0A6J4MA38_9BACT|nr:MAG: hypothetical protein AVDCRST_MAG89-3309 [uncultured Gemmatimonadota bacterium]